MKWGLIKYELFRISRAIRFFWVLFFPFYLFFNTWIKNFKRRLKDYKSIVVEKLKILL